MEILIRILLKQYSKYILMNDNWLVKYESKNLDDFGNNQDIIAKIENTLNNDKSIIIKGNCGMEKIIY